MDKRARITVAVALVAAILLAFALRSAPERGRPEDAARLTAEATAALKASRFDEALRLCEAALAMKSSQNATVVCAMAACQLRSRDTARRYIAKIQNATYTMMVRQVCLRNGVDPGDS